MTEVITRAQHELMRQGAENLALRVRLADAEINEERYRKLRAWLKNEGFCTAHAPTGPWIYNGESGLRFYGDFDAAVDTLPEPESAEQKQEIGGG